MFGEKKADCPLWRGPCRESKCRWFTHVMGMNPNTGEQINKQGCSIEFLPMLLIENAQQARQTGASIDRFNCDMLKLNGVAAASGAALGAIETPMLSKSKP